MSGAEAAVYRHSCGDCQTCPGNDEQPCGWGFDHGHTYPTCPGRARCGKPWPGCHHCGEPTPCPEPCWGLPRDAAGNLLLFEVAA